MSDVLVVDRQRFRLELWRRPSPTAVGYVRRNKWPIAVGAVGHATPRGVYVVDNISRTPDWMAPNAEWVPKEDRGRIFPFKDPRNPFAGGFISISGGEGVGIHGTKFDPEVGTRASHGCIRMLTEDFKALYGKVTVGDTIVAIF